MPEEDFKKISCAFLTDCEVLHLLPSSDIHLFKAILYVKKYNLNSADAYHLSNTIYLKDTLTPLNNNVTLISTDKRLIKATKSEDINVFDPENDTIDNLSKLLDMIS